MDNSGSTGFGGKTTRCWYYWCSDFRWPL